jgi:hypothetical protein
MFFFNYHRMIFSGWNLIPGDKGDSRLLIFILEHWHRTFTGQENWLDLKMFYPAKNILGYSDVLFLLALPYSLFRLLGFDYFSSYQFVFIFMSTLGYVCGYLMLRRVFKVNVYFSVLGAVLLVSLNSMQVQMGHGQLLGFYFYPLLILLFHSFLETKNKRSVIAFVVLGCFGLLLGFLFFTSYYPAWFFVFALGLFGVVFFFSRVIRKTFDLKSLFQWLKETWPAMVVGIVAFFVAMVPFIITYLPIFKEGLQRDFGEVLTYTPHIRDVFNVSTGNEVWGALLQQWHFPFDGMETQMGFPPFGLLLLGLAILYLFVWSRKNQSSVQMLTVKLLVVVSFIIFGLAVQVHGLSLWWFVWRLVPGAQALRALGRIFIVCDLIVAVVLIYVADQIFGKVVKLGQKNSVPFWVISSALLLLPFLLVAEQANSGYYYKKDEQVAMLGRVKQPASCTSFYIIDHTKNTTRLPYIVTDAFMIALKLHLELVNGYSGFMAAPVFSIAQNGPEYEYGITKWLKEHQVSKGVDSLDLSTGKFTPVDIEQTFKQVSSELYALALSRFTRLFDSATKFLGQDNPLKDLLPKKLEESGYLDSSYGFAPGVANNWTNNGCWVGAWDLPKTFGPGPFFGVGLVGELDFVKPIIEKFKSSSIRIYFPYPQDYDPKLTSGNGQLLIIFKVPITEKK